MRLFAAGLFFLGCMSVGAESSYRFDFGPVEGAFASGWVRVCQQSYNPQLGWGWESAPDMARRRNADSDLMKDTLVAVSSKSLPAQFRVDLPAGRYRLRATVYDPRYNFSAHLIVNEEASPWVFKTMPAKGVDPDRRPLVVERDVTVENGLRIKIPPAGSLSVACSILNGLEIFPLEGGQELPAVSPAPEISSPSPVDQTSILPPAAMKEFPEQTDHPDASIIARFLAQQKDSVIQPTGLNKQEYLRIINGQVLGLMKYQNAAGDIVDPWYEGDSVFGKTGEPGNRRYRHYATPHFAHAASLLIKSGYNTDPAVVESAAKAIEASIARMLKGHESGTPTAWNCGDFYPYALTRAWLNLKGCVDPQRYDRWTEDYKRVNPDRVYGSPVSKGNWVVVSHCGEYLRSMQGLTTPDRAEKMLDFKKGAFTERGTWTFESYAYDAFPRYHITGILADGYRGASFPFYQDRMWRGSWVSLLTQSPFGTHPTGFRSAHHAWNEAQLTAIFEIYAAAYASAGKPAAAGAYKRAARLSLQSVGRWVREDGTLNIVKNRISPQERHAYEMYSLHTCYNALTAHMLARAYEAADDSIEEKPAPADVGGYAYVLDEDYSKEFSGAHNYHAVFANASGSMIQYSLDTGLDYEPVGLQRVHIRGASPVIGPSDGLGTKFGDHQTILAVGPGWIGADGKEHRLAAQPVKPQITVLEESPQRVRFQADFMIPQLMTATDESGKMVFDVQGLTVAESGFDFSGANAHMITRNALPLLAGDWAVGLEFYAKATTGRQTLVSMFGEGKEQHAFLVETDDRRGIRVLFRNPPGKEGGTTLYSDCPVEAGRWHNLAVRYESGVLTIELNGRSVASGQTGAPVSDPMYALFGRIYRENSQRAFKGLIRNVRLSHGGASGETYVIPMKQLDGAATLHLRETVSLEKGRVTVEDEMIAGDIRAMTVNYPFIASDGENTTELVLQGNAAEMRLLGSGSRVVLKVPAGEFEHRALHLLHENGWMDLLRAEVPGRKAVYTIEPAAAR